jgi:hypothetical protein
VLRADRPPAALVDSLVAALLGGGSSTMLSGTCRQIKLTLVPTFTTKNRFFEPLIVALVSIYSVSTMRNAQLNGAASGVRPGETTIMCGKPTSGIQLRFELTQILDPISRNQWPEQLVIEEEPVNEPLKDPNAMATGRMGFTWALMGQAYMTFYERLLESIEEREGRDWSRWSTEVWKFGYQVRNAVAHSGEIHFANPKAPAVTWRGVTYSPSDNGRKVFAELGVVELLLLMDELDSSI